MASLVTAEPSTPMLGRARTRVTERLANARILDAHLCGLTEEFARFARRQYVNASMNPTHDDRRDQERHPLLLPVLAVPIDEADQPSGLPFEMITRDVSDTAIGLLSEEPISYPRIAATFELRGQPILFTASLIRCDARGPYFGCVFRFLEDLAVFPVPPEVLDEIRTFNLQERESLRVSI